MRIWSEKNSRADITASGFTLIDNAIACSAGLIVLLAAIAIVGVLS